MLDKIPGKVLIIVAGVVVGLAVILGIAAVVTGM